MPPRRKRAHQPQQEQEDAAGEPAQHARPTRSGAHAAAATAAADPATGKRSRGATPAGNGGSHTPRPSSPVTAHRRPSPLPPHSPLAKAGAGTEPSAPEPANAEQHGAAGLASGPHANGAAAAGESAHRHHNHHPHRRHAQAHGLLGPKGTLTSAAKRVRARLQHLLRPSSPFVWIAAALVVAGAALLLAPMIEESPLPGLVKDLGSKLNVTLDSLAISNININLAMWYNASLPSRDTLADLLAPGTINAAWRALLSQLPAFNVAAVSGPAADPAAGESVRRPGLIMAKRGFKAKHPVAIVPGFITSGLELWQGLPCGRKYFRQRMWGTLTMMQVFLLDPQCWFSHMELDPVTGLDPPGIKLRAATGLEAVDYFIQGYWVWSKLVEALGDVGYDSNNLVSLAYDWRLGMPLLEARDGFFSRFRATVETLVAVSGEKAVVVMHSFGENVVRSFLAWVEAEQDGWTELHVEALVNIAGTSLGVPKSVSALLSGETYDTAQLGPLSGFLTSNLVPRGTRTRLWRTWGSAYAMMPVGGTRVWGNSSWAPDDTPEMRAHNLTFGNMVTVWPHDWQQRVAAAAELLAANATQQAASVRSDNGTAPSRASTTADAALDAAASAASVASGNSSAAAASAGAGTGAANSSGLAAAMSSAAGALSQPMSALTEKVKRLLASSNSTSPVDFLHMVAVSTLDVDGFLALLKEIGGPLLAEHAQAWGPVTLPSEAARQQAELAKAHVEAAAGHGGQPGEQAVGGVRHARKAVKRPALFADATTTPLPNAPNLKIVCLYGIGVPTERAYHYMRPPPPAASTAAEGGSAAPSAANASTSSQQPAGDGVADECEGGADDGTVEGTAGAGRTCRPQGARAVEDAAEAAEGGEDVLLPNTPASGGEASVWTGDLTGGWAMMSALSHADMSMENGVQLGDGDGSVPLLSLGLMCRKGWAPGSRLNPGGSRVVTREYKHRPVSLLQDPRGGPASAAHVDILGNEAMLMDVIWVAAGRVAELSDDIHSDIDRIAQSVDI